MSAIEEIKALKVELQEKIKKAFMDAFPPIFTKYPWISSISWEQYTDYWNDGDACTFSSKAVYGEFEWNDQEDDVLLPSDNEDCDDANNEISALLEAFDHDDYLWLFGDHARIIVRPAGITVEEYTDRE